MFVYRRCGRCKEDLPEAAFNRAPRGRQHWCRECFRSYFRERGRTHLVQVRAARATRKATLQEHVLAHLQTNPCTDCGESDSRVLDFDHISQKEGEVGALVASGVPLERLKQEMARCEVVCANCHRRRTATRAGWWRLTGPPAVDAVRRPRQLRNVAWVYSLLRRSCCADCGDRDPVVLEFDHVGHKRGAVMHLAWSEYSIATLEHEVAQCEIRCCNCHRRRTGEANGWFRSVAR
jgi:hypothetical protein